MLRSVLLVGAIVLGCPAFSLVCAEDWPQWQGPTRSGEYNTPGLIERFPDSGAPVRWRAPVAGGYAGPAVAGGRVFVADYVRSAGEPTNDPNVRAQLQGQERLVCLEEATGKQLWVYAYDQPYGISYPAGPRATPTVDGDLVYMLGAEGRLTALTVADGAPVWSVDLKETYKAPTPVWGFAGHPLVHGDKLYVMVGGPGALGVCLDKKTGKELWRTLESKDAGYSPPTLISVDGQQQLILWAPDAIHSVNLETGKPYWAVPLEPNYGMSIIAPRQEGNFLFASAIVRQGRMLKLNGTAAPAEVWKTSPKLGIGPVHSPVLSVDGVMYGIDGEGELAAFKAETGEKLWTTYAVTTGDRRANSATAFLTRLGDRFLIFNEHGDLILARLTPEKYEELSRTHVIEPTQETMGRKVVWTAPALANRCVYLRNDKEVICVDLSAK